MGEEYQLIAGSSQNLALLLPRPSPQRVAGSNESAITGGARPLRRRGHRAELLRRDHTSARSRPDTPLIVGQGRGHHDRRASPGAQQYNIYVSTNASAGAGQRVPAGRDHGPGGRRHAGSQSANAVGGIKFTLQGALATSASRTRPAADTGTGGVNRMEGLIPTLSGLSATGTGPYANVGLRVRRVQRLAGRLRQPDRRHPPVAPTPSSRRWTPCGRTTASTTSPRACTGPTRPRSSPTAATSCASPTTSSSQGAGLNYLLNISQDQISGVRAGAAVAEFVNPVTRSTLKLTVHPWLSRRAPRCSCRTSSRRRGATSTMLGSRVCAGLSFR